MVVILRKCEEHSMALGYRRNPNECVILDHSIGDAVDYQLYVEFIPHRSAFVYLGVLFKPCGLISTPDNELSLDESL
ncbi:hypothetical protein BCV72DRAFT_211922 [Rhizopus microsporus var. microsporus]|uniref:Uncharacterized protein n=1 Tax=Rhizopus microsporus var. microsporus TaxID=86635 RepID=A0A1X0QWN6_RHIZD|nr:hypothetical protein BCV72DRAFT_211922 [Rhizopus microsporus var. microsporus]